IYANKCGAKNKYLKLTTIKNNSYKATKVAGSKIKKGTYYKFLIVALDADNNVISTSKTIHAATTGGKVGNDKSVTTKAKKNKVSVKVGKTFKLKAKTKAASKKLKVKKHRAIKYESSDPAKATVSDKGVITGVSKGTCYVYAYAQNGVCAKIKVTIK
ncbi:MAG: Ig-like domain-containing protein, partial [Lachnospiraceae bacterium]|nr:Ig-like domain-containing protein [Lachnospiraceae bacterium]